MYQKCTLDMFVIRYNALQTQALQKLFFKIHFLFPITLTTSSDSNIFVSYVGHCVRPGSYSNMWGG